MDMSINITDRRSPETKKVYFVSLVAYVLAIVVTLVVLVSEPDGFDARMAILPLIIMLLVSGLGIGQYIAADAQDPRIRVVGTTVLAVLLAFVGFFVIAGGAWVVALSRA